jgi:hypothetical protein
MKRGATSPARPASTITMMLKKTAAGMRSAGYEIPTVSDDTLNER